MGGRYLDPEFLEPGGTVTRQGYVTNIIADMALDWLAQRDPERPFFLYLGNKAPHDPFTWDEAHADMFADVDLPEAAHLARRLPHPRRGGAALHAEGGHHEAGPRTGPGAPGAQR